MSVTVHSGGEALDVMVIVRELMQRPDFSIDMLKELLALRAQAEQREADRDFQLAFARCQANVTAAKRDKPNPMFQSRYATIESMYAAVWPAVMAEGFDWTVTVLPTAPEGWDNTVLWFQGRLSKDIASRTVELPVSRDALRPEGAKGGRSAMTPTQAIGALTTYMRKYLLGIMFSVVTEDDVRLDNDGNRRETKPPPNRPSNGTGKPPDPLDEPNGVQWVKNVDALLHAAQARQDVLDLQGDVRVVRVREAAETPAPVKARIDAMFDAAFARFDDKDEAEIEDPRDAINREVPLAPDPSLDRLAELQAEVEGMDLITIAGLPTSAAWRAKVRELLPPDETTLDDTIAARKAALQATQGRT